MFLLQLDLRYSGIDEPDYGIYVILNGIVVAMVSTLPRESSECLNQTVF